MGARAGACRALLPSLLLELAPGIEPGTSSLPRKRSTTELREPTLELQGESPASGDSGQYPHAEAASGARLRCHPGQGRYPHGESNPGLLAENQIS
jgi:hypothetical protein